MAISVTKQEYKGDNTNIFVNQAELFLNRNAETQILESVQFRDMESGTVYAYYQQDMSPQIWEELATTRLPTESDSGVSRFVKFSTDKDGKKLRWVSPIDGTFIVQLAEIMSWQAKENDVPVGDPVVTIREKLLKPWSTQDGRSGTIPAHKEFMVRFKIVSLRPESPCAFNGMSITANIWYLFDAERDGQGRPTGETTISWGNKARMAEFKLVLKLSGIDIDDESATLPRYSDNILNGLLPTLVYSDQPVQMKLAKGWMKKGFKTKHEG